MRAGAEGARSGGGGRQGGWTAGPLQTLACTASWVRALTAAAGRLDGGPFYNSNREFQSALEGVLFDRQHQARGPPRKNIIIIIIIIIINYLARWQGVLLDRQHQARGPSRKNYNDNDNNIDNMMMIIQHNLTRWQGVLVDRQHPARGPFRTRGATCSIETSAVQY